MPVSNLEVRSEGSTRMHNNPYLSIYTYINSHHVSSLVLVSADLILSFITNNFNAVQPGEIPVLILTREIWNPTRFWSVLMTYNDMGHSLENWTKEGAAFLLNFF